MNLYLNRQKRDRDLHDYLEKLCVTSNEFDELNRTDKRLLLVGGGYSSTCDFFCNMTVMQIVNIDYAPNTEFKSERIKNVKGNFYEVINRYENYFDEIWALYSLPLYAPTENAAMMFIYNAVQSVICKGKIRFFPVEKEACTKMHTRDADYDITTDECRNAVLAALLKIQKFGAEYDIVQFQNNKADRQEDTVIISLSLSESEKTILNDWLRKECHLLTSDQKGNISSINLLF